MHCFKLQLGEKNAKTKEKPEKKRKPENRHHPPLPVMDWIQIQVKFLQKLKVLSLFIIESKLVKELDFLELLDEFARLEGKKGG